MIKWSYKNTKYKYKKQIKIQNTNTKNKSRITNTKNKYKTNQENLLHVWKTPTWIIEQQVQYVISLSELEMNTNYEKDIFR